MSKQDRKVYREKVLGLTFTEDGNRIEVKSTILDDEVLYDEPLDSRTPDLLTEVFEGFGRAFGE